ncbi:MAG: ribulose-phosphate 3-epimerase, partial [Candidatus Rokubacteria bacterium]|nr:ribulose-phosphate 3-epimerase [Candidatus Rokubacteria bacterium]
FGGQAFIPAGYAKVRQVRTLRGKRPAEVSVDGGVKLEHAAPLTAHGASVLVAGSLIFGAPDPGAVVKQLRDAAEVSKSP